MIEQTTEQEQVAKADCKSRIEPMLLLGAYVIVIIAYAFLECH